ncbi:MAG: polymer-forming cytoskeletal protein [Paenibacillaceae bacterium]|jgi:cytoskeletal protein CcmA (bactofilin family)|nr:polymer-forming cytoskeletal protein [Paenibacillaceae bacterium]
MFKGKKSNGINPNSTDTIIGEGSVFEGRIKSEAGVRVEGSITGDVESSGDVIIGEKGSVKSNINARNIIIAGTVLGNVTAKEKLTILSSGQLIGNSTTVSLVIEDGGVFSGTSKMEGKAAAKDSTLDKEPAASTKPFTNSFGDSMAM